MGGSRAAVLISNATLPDQRSVIGPLDRIARMADEAAIEPPATLVVGDVFAAERALDLAIQSLAASHA